MATVCFVLLLLLRYTDKHIQNQKETQPLRKRKKKKKLIIPRKSKETIKCPFR